eukprot:RCo039992
MCLARFRHGLRWAVPQMRCWACAPPRWPQQRAYVSSKLQEHPLLAEARQLLGQRKEKEALEKYQQLLTEEPSNVLAHANLAILLQYVDMDQAQTHFSRAVELGAAEDPDFSGQYANFLASEKQDRGQAEVYFQKATAHPQCSGMVHFLYGKLLHEDKNYDGARVAYEKALEAPAGSLP